MTSDDPNLRLAPEDGDITSNWTTETADLHFYGYSFDDYGTEVVSLDAAYEHRVDIKALDWETTHRKWTGEAWQLDFAALDATFKHFCDRDYSVTVNTSAINIYLSDFDAPFLVVHVPDDPPPYSGGGTADGTYETLDEY